MILLGNRKQSPLVWCAGGVFVVSSTIALLVALGAQHFLNMIPCELCLWERGPWRVLLGIGILTLVVSPRYARWLVVCGMVCLCVSVGLSILHIGVEQAWWPSPAAECHVSLVNGGTFSEWMKNLPSHPAKPCDLPDYPFGMPISMTTLSGLYSIGILVCGIWSAIRLFTGMRHNQC